MTMTIQTENERALGRAIRAMLRVGDELPVAMQSALLRLAVSEWPEPRPVSMRLGTQKPTHTITEHADANECEAQEGCLAGSATR